MNQLGDRVALITGAGSGIGKAIALELARRGSRVVVNDVRADEARRGAKEIESLGQTALPIVADVSDSAQVQAMVGEAVERFGRLDILVNNAGVAPKALLQDITDDHWLKVVGIHLNGTFYCTRAVIPAMKTQRHGRIVNISSVVAKRIAPYTSAAYTAAKAGILGLTRQAAFELGGFGITVNAVCPGQTLTPLRASIIQSEEFIQRDLDRIPLGRLAAPEDIARAVAFLASDEAAYITGASLVVDGGMLTSWMPYTKYAEAVGIA